MKFTRTEPNKDFDIIRCVSENNKWEIGIRQMLFGVRICGNPTGNGAYSFDYCAGDDQLFALELFAAVVNILERYTEETTSTQIRIDFPPYEIKPINKDPYCWKRLQEMAENEDEILS